MLAEHGTEHDAQEALQMFEAFVKLRVTLADERVGNLPTSMVLKGRATGQRLKSAAEADHPTKRQRDRLQVQKCKNHVRRTRTDLIHHSIAMKRKCFECQCPLPLLLVLHLLAKVGATRLQNPVSAVQTLSPCNNYGVTDV